MIPEKLLVKLARRHANKSMRELRTTSGLIDFSSNDYLGFSNKLKPASSNKHGATGSRLLTGQTEICQQLEQKIAAFHKTESALIFNSGYDANLGLISSVAQRGDLILYDEYVHASIRDAMKLSDAKSLKFRHNDLGHLSILLDKFSKEENQEVYIITESVFSMDGDMPNLVELVNLAKNKDNVHIILDEAHALGTVGNNGEGLAQSQNLQDDIFARIVTYGKSMGCHGAAVLGGFDLNQFLVNFARSFVYTTALPQHSLNCISNAYDLLAQDSKEVENLQLLVIKFNRLVVQSGLRLRFRESVTPIQTCIIPDNDVVKKAALQLQEKGYDIRPILSPTVPAGEERLRICLHSFNTIEQCEKMLHTLAAILKKR
ncbi:8-amino-7-oxononanoate synthase [Nonlabens sp. Hel1_33_55]|uniref:aminotransferase class I/II-fold pyridoxal phosphate-dependent enzyme n=1 Tax=Nonlabens sp. Hel1_33_55 TaxID=1336802 RepID=UPI000875C366|nr:aminotransferase class I/II-fold pyridoxal phosphate-dependent enzyme [Nonlabens sp. Hel1_33_55]SCY35687.1 8-amino-7-oxononanoate synthase [Nonlabens sp. Hel1_33_55]